jgi:hypothetical protein
MMFLYKRWVWKIGYVVDLSTTFDADVQTFSLDPIKKQLLNIQTFQKINHSFQK